ncbi:MAG: AAA family ATPase [Bacteroidetes bacterium]|nr:AAA family ATPase [Bacteroidota bacterium]
MTSEELDALLKEAYEHLSQGRFRMALTAAKQVYEERQYDFNAASCLAWALLENGFSSQALEMANLAVQISGDEVSSRLYRGFLLMRMSIFEGAISDLDWAIKKKPDLLAWAHLNKARALGGLGRFFEGLEEIEKAIEIDKGSTPKLIKVRDWFKKTLGYDEGFFSGIFTKKKSLINEGEESFKEKEYWFSLWAARETLNSPSLKNEHTDAHLLELESLYAMFQMRNAYILAESLKDQLSENPNFQNTYQRITKYFKSDDLSSIEDPITQTAKRTDHEIYENKIYHIYQVKTYDLLENLRSEKRTFLLQFNEETIRYIGVEVILENPFYKNKRMDVDGTAVWFLNNIEVGRHQFLIAMEKDWKLVEFIQSWGTDTPGFWKEGQGRVDIYLDNNLVCSRWFTVGQSEIFNFEETVIPSSDSESLEKPTTDQPNRLNESKLKPQETKSLDELLLELDSYIGLQNVKQSMRDFVDYLNFINERKKLGLKTQENFAVHSVFLGNPGTGKTTIARLLGKIFKAMGLLKNGHVIEVDRSGLVGQYIGETAQKTNKVIDEAMGGLLFIDEAYTLKKEGNQQDFGQEAIDILLKRMEDSKGEFVVIAAGYPEEMNAFINSNPGLKSRFNHFFKFDDYIPEELVEIFKLTSSKEEYNIIEDALELLKKQFTNLYRKRDKSFGNARLVRNYFNEIKIHIGKRYLKLSESERTKESMVTIYPEDILSILESPENKNVKIGIDEEALARLLKKLNELVGVQSVKKEISEIVKLARFYSEQGENLQNKFSSHMIFLGNPGTGKTTVARLFSELYSALGILPKGHLIEVDRQGLVASFVGQTAEKTKNAIDKAIGGTMFIDEAYTLIKSNENSSSDFGKEALDTLLKRMEDDRGKFIVIAAGYTEEMNNFLNSNPGLQSRFTKKIYFEDYTPDELLKITEKLLESKEFILDEEVRDPLKKYFNIIFRSRDKTFGNARIVRDIVESALKNQLLRVADIPAEERHEEVLKYILLEDLNDLITPKKEKEKRKIEGDPEQLEKYINELKDLAGLDSVKKSVDKLISSLKVAKLRKQRGLKIIPKNLNSVFMGNSGTGKTTVARLISKIYKEMGILEKGHLIEVDRSNLVAGYQGQTATKTNDIIDKALGGTLFIDEAYTLARGSSDFGQEAIDTLLKRMEDDQGKFVVIVAGYTEEMKDFLDSNPGVQSRFPNIFTFEDYDPRQMLEIANVISEKNSYKLDEGAWQLLLEIFTKLFDERDKNFGNARTVKNILYKAISNQEERILTLYEPDVNDLSTIIYEDVSKIELKEL